MSERFVEGVRLSNPDKVLYPEQGITKGDLADHYVAVADRMLPHVALRPITMVRCPTGRQRNCFYQRHAGAGVARQIEKVTVPGFDNPYLFIRDLPGLIALVQMGVLEIHPWGVRIDRPDRPDRVIFDLDPGEGLGFDSVVAAALDVHDRLAALGLTSFVKTTGGKGLHVVLPIAASPRLAHGQGLGQGAVRADGGRRSGSLSDQGLQGRAHRADLHRLPAQRPDLDRGRALFDSGSPRGPGGGSARLDGADSGPRSGAVHRSDGSRTDRPGQGSVGGTFQASPEAS